MKIYHLLIILLSIAVNSQAQILTPQSKEYITTFDEPKAESLASFITKKVKDKRIVGLGEVSHYTRECYLLKHEIIKKLMIEGFTGLVLEVDFGQALIWNDYVTNGNGNLDSIISESGWFTYRTAEFKNILSDIRKHNETAEIPFQVFGMEMTAMNHNLDWLKNNLKDFTAAESIMNLLGQERKIVAFQQYDLEERMDYWQLYSSLQNFIDEQESTLLKEKGEKRTSIIKQIIEITRQYATYITQDDFGLKSEFRDQFSARNMYWCMMQLGEESKIAIWAHNGHIAKESVLFNYNILGHHLNRWFGDAYYSIGFSFNQGEFGAFSNDGFKRFELNNLDTVSLTKDFHQQKTPFLIYDVQAHLRADSNPDLFLRKGNYSGSKLNE